MLKKIVSTLLVCIVLTSCTSKSNSIEGIWMAENGDTVTFNSNAKAIVDNISMDYSVFDGNKLTITMLGFANEYSFAIKKDTLTLADIKNDFSQVYYKDEKKQEQIKQALELEANSSIMEEEGLLYDSYIQNEYASEQQALECIISLYKQRASQCTTSCGRQLCMGYVTEAQERKQLLETGTSKQIQADSYSIAAEIVKNYVLPEKIAESEELTMMDEGTQYISNTDDGSSFIGCMVDVRDINNMTALDYGTYAVKLSSGLIYKYDTELSKWSIAYQIPQQGTYTFVLDDAGILSTDTAEYIQDTNLNLKSLTGAEIVVDIVNSTGSMDIGEYTRAKWDSLGEIGSPKLNNGILIVLALDNLYKGQPDGDYYIAYGSGFDDDEGKSLINILRENMETDFAAKQYDKATLKTFNAAIEYLTGLYSVAL